MRHVQRGRHFRYIEYQKSDVMTCRSWWVNMVVFYQPQTKLSNDQKIEALAEWREDSSKITTDL